MAEEEKNTPRPLGIKPITIKPMTPPAPFPAPPAGDAEAAPTSPGAPSAVKSSTQQLTPTVIQPKGVPQPLQRPAPLVSTPLSQKPADEGKPPAHLSAGGDAAGKALGAQPTSTTIRLKPVAPSQPPTTSPASPGTTAQIKPMRPPTIQPPSIKPSASPVNESAAKSKTSRISLDAVFADSSSASKSSTGPAPVGKITGNLTAAAEDSDATRRPTLRFNPSPKTGADAEGIGESPTVKKKKPLVLKKDRQDAPAAGAASAPAGDQAAGNDNISAFSAFQAAPVEKTNVFFPIVAVMTCFVIVALILMYMSQASGPDRSLTAYSTMPGGPNIGWPGKVMTNR